MTNGICEITVKGVKHALYFGRLAQEEISLRTETNVLGNPIKVLTDMIHAGRVNWAYKQDTVYPSWKETTDLVDDWLEEENFPEQNEAVDKCFRESKYGKQLLEGWEELKKKMEELLLETAKELSKTSESTGENSESTA